MSILDQIPSPSFIFDPSQANENRDVLTQIRRIAKETGQETAPYTRTGVKLTPNKAGILTQADANVPAVSFDQAFNKGYLAEAGATNLLQRSEEFDDAYWSKVNTNITPNATVAPDGTTTADLVDINDSTSRVIRSVSLASGTYTLSLFCKINNQTQAGDARVVFVTSVNNSFSFTPTTQWKRFSFTFTAGETITEIAVVRGNASEFEGVLSIWGAQLETGSVATSYIPTTGSTASRGADNLVFTDAQDIIGQQSGVILVEAAWFDNGDEINHPNGLKIGRSDTVLRGLALGINSQGNLRFNSRNTAGSSSFNIDAGYIKGDFKKIAVSYDYNGQAPNTTVTNGVKIAIGGEIVVTNDLRVPDVGQNLNTIQCIGSTGGPQADSSIISTLFNRIYKWNNSAWLTDELAQLLTS